MRTVRLGLALLGMLTFAASATAQTAPPPTPPPVVQPPPPTTPPPPPPAVEPPPPPTTPEPPAAGCGSDNDCKGNRICVDGKCVDTTPGTPEKPKPTVTSSRFSGSLQGAGSINFTLTGSSITHGSAHAGGRSFSLRNTKLSGKSFRLIGNSGGDSLQVSGTVSGTWAKGTFTATIARKRVSGAMSASRR